MKHSRPLPVIIAFCFIAIAQNSSAQSLKDAVATALEFAPEAVAAESAASASNSDVKAAKGALLPKITLTGSAGAAMRERDDTALSSSGEWLYARELRLSIIQQLYDGGKDRALVDAARETALASEMMLRKTDDSVALGAVEAYVGVLRARDLIAVAQENVVAHEDALDKATQQADAGGDRSNKALVKGRLGLARSVVSSRVALQKAAEIRFERYVGSSPENLSNVSLPYGMPHSIEEIDTSHAWDFLIEKHLAAAAAHEVKAARAAWAPELNAEARGGIGENVSGIAGADNEVAFFVTMGWSLFDFSRDPSIQAAVFRAKQAEELALNSRLIADQQAGQAWTDYSTAQRQVMVLKEHSTQIREVDSDFRDQFKLGKRSLLNILDIRNEKFRADSALIDTRYQKILAAYRLLAATGDLADTILGSGKGVIEPVDLAEDGPASLPIAVAKRIKNPAPEKEMIAEEPEAKVENIAASDESEMVIAEAKAIKPGPFAKFFKRKPASQKEEAEELTESPEPSKPAESH